MSAITKEPRTMSFLWQRLSVAVQCGNAACILGTEKWNYDDTLLINLLKKILLLQNMIFSSTDIHFNLLVRKTSKTPARLKISVRTSLRNAPRFIRIFHDFGLHILTDLRSHIIVFAPTLFARNLLFGLRWP